MAQHEKDLTIFSVFVAQIFVAMRKSVAHLDVQRGLRFEIDSARSHFSSACIGAKSFDIVRLCSAKMAFEVNSVPLSRASRLRMAANIYARLAALTRGILKGKRARASGASTNDIRQLPSQHGRSFRIKLPGELVRPLGCLSGFSTFSGNKNGARGGYDPRHNLTLRP